MMPIFLVLVVLAIAKHLPLLVLVGMFWLMWAKTSSHARRTARRRQWDDGWGRR